MATILTAGNATNGLSLTPDNTGILELKTGTGAGTTAVTISTAQVVNFANAPTGAGMLTSGTAVTVSGTSIDFTGIPSTAKRITVMFNGVSTSGTSNLQIQIGSTTFTISGYQSVATYSQNAVAPTVANSTTGFLVTPVSGAAEVISGTVVITLLSSNIWTCFGSVCDTANVNNLNVCSGSLSLGGVLDRIRITTVNGTDTFDAGSINILWE